MKKLICLTLALVTSITNANEVVLLTGAISSANQQIVSAPKTNRWQVQLQWLEEEGKTVNVGDLIAVFDSSSYQTQIKQNKEQLKSKKLQAKLNIKELAQEVTEAEGKLALSKLQMEKALVEAQIQSDDVSDFDKGKYKLELERAVFNKVKDEQNLLQVQKKQQTELNKQQIEIVKLEEKIAYQSQMMDRVKVTAQVNGVVSHKMHPWNGSKIAAGTMLQASMQAMSVEALGDFIVEAWVHEVDAEKLAIGMQANLVLDSNSSAKHLASLISLASQSEKKEDWSESAYQKAVFKFDTQPQMSLVPGMSVRIELEQQGESRD